MKAGHVLQATTALLVSGALLWSTTLQAFSFCFSSGGKSRGAAYSNSRYSPPYGAWLPPPMPAMPYSHAPHPGTYYYPESQATMEAVAPVENQGLDYIMR